MTLQHLIITITGLWPGRQTSSMATCLHPFRHVTIGPGPAASDVPTGLKQAMLSQLTALFENSGD